MAESIEIEFDTSEDPIGGATVGNNWWAAQQFTTVAGFNCSKVSVYMNIADDDPASTTTLGIYAVDGNGHPTGNALVEKTIDSSEWGNDFEWKEFEFDEAYELSAATKYAIQINTPAEVCVLGWAYKADGYAGGIYVNSVDSGQNWNDQAGFDAGFRVYSETSSAQGNSLMLDSLGQAWTW